MKRFLFWALLAAFVAACVGYAFHFPCRPEVLYRAVPMRASLVTEHQRLAERWQALASNAMVRSAIRSLGATEAEIDEFAADPATVRLARRLVSRRTVVACIPAPADPPVWVAASWVGGYGQVLKMEMALRLIPGFRRVRLEGGRQAWELKGGLSHGRQRLSLALVEGVLYACLSPDPAGVQYLLNRVESAAPLVPELQASLAAEAQPGAAPLPPDRGWWFGYQVQNGVRVPRRTQFEVDAGDRTVLNARVWGDWSLPGYNVQKSARPVAEDAIVGATGGLGRVLSDFPGALAVLRYADVKPVLMEGADTGSVGVVRAFLRTNILEQGAAFICLSGTNYSGRLFGFRTPALLAGVQMANPAAARGMIAGALDELNARRRLGLIANSMTVGDQQVTVLEGLAPSVYRELAPAERVAFAVKANWLIFASNVGALTNLIERTGLDRPGAWASRIGAGRPASVLWMDVNAGGDILAKSLAVYDLLSYARGLKRPTGGAREQWDVVLRGVQALRDAGTLTAWVEPDGGKSDPVVHLTLGPAAGPTP